MLVQRGALKPMLKKILCTPVKIEPDNPTLMVCKKNLDINTTQIRPGSEYHTRTILYKLLVKVRDSRVTIMSSYYEV